MTEYIIDAYAWVEYLEGTVQGQKVKEIIGKHKCFTSAVTLAEVISKAKRSRKDSGIAFEAVALNSKVLSVTEEIAFKAGEIHAEKKEKNKTFGLADAFILAHRSNKQKILTRDPHFKGIKKVEFLK